MGRFAKIIGAVALIGTACWNLAAQADQAPSTLFAGWVERYAAEQNHIARRLIVREFDVEGQEQGQREIPLDDQGMPTVGRRNAGNSDAQFDISSLYSAFFRINWDVSTLARSETRGELEGPRSAMVFTINGLDKDNRPMEGRILYDPTSGQLLQTIARSSNQEYPMLISDYRDGSVHRVSIRNLDERGIRPDRIRLASFYY